MFFVLDIFLSFCLRHRVHHVLPCQQLFFGQCCFSTDHHGDLQRSWCRRGTGTNLLLNRVFPLAGHYLFARVRCCGGGSCCCCCCCFCCCLVWLVVGCCLLTVFCCWLWWWLCWWLWMWWWLVCVLVRLFISSCVCVWWVPCAVPLCRCVVLCRAVSSSLSLVFVVVVVCCCLFVSEVKFLDLFKKKRTTAKTFANDVFIDKERR